MADKVEYSKDGERLKIAQTVTSVSEESYSLKELITRREQLIQNRDAYEAKANLEIANWNVAIGLVDEQIVQAQSLGVTK